MGNFARRSSSSPAVFWAQTAPKPTEEFLEALDDAFVVAIRAPGEPEAPFLSAQFPSAGTPETTGRIVYVEVIR